MIKREIKTDENPYEKIFGQKFCSGITSDTAYQLLAFTAYFESQGNSLNGEELLDKITELSPSPYNIFQDKDGFLLRFELDKPIYIENEVHEKQLQQNILNFLEKNKVVKGTLQELEIGRWDSHTILTNEDCEVIQR